MRTRDRMYLGRIRSVRNISRDDRARIATCSLRTPTDRLMKNYSIDYEAVDSYLCQGVFVCTWFFCLCSVYVLFCVIVPAIDCSNISKSVLSYQL